MRGWVSIHRKLQKNESLWLSEPFSRGQAWVDLLLLTNYEDGYIRVAGQRIAINKGQCGWSKVRLAERWQWSRGKVERFLDELEQDNRITREQNNRTTIITICNYTDYQKNDTSDDTTDSTPKRTSNGHQTDTKNKNNKYNNTTADAGARARNSRIIGEQISKITGWDKDPNWTGNYSRIDQWLANGWDAEKDILPTVQTLMVKKTGPPPRSLKYFEQAIADAYAYRTSPIPKGSPDEANSNSSQRNHAPSLSERADQATREVLAEYGIEPQDHADHDDGAAVLRHPEHLRQDTGAVENPAKGHD